MTRPAADSLTPADLQSIVREALRRKPSSCSCFADGGKNHRQCVGVCEDAVDKLAETIALIMTQERERVAKKCDENAKLLRDMVPKLRKNGHQTMAELKVVQAEQTEGIAAAIRAMGETGPQG